MKHIKTSFWNFNLQNSYRIEIISSHETNFSHNLIRIQ